jgi:hypothetical protein
MVTAREVEREGRRVLRVLVARKACLKKRLATPGRATVWHVCAPNGTRKRAIPAVEDIVVAALVERHWLEAAAQDVAVAGRAGLEWLGTQRQGQARREASEVPTRGAPRTAGPIANPGAGLVNHAECPLSWLRQRKDNTGQSILSESQYAAGERLRGDFEAAGLRQSVTARWDQAAPRRTKRMRSAYREHCPTDAAIDARRRFYAALEAVGPELSDALTDVCCHLFGLEALERRRGWPRRSAKLVLQIALTQLARHYGLERGKPAPVNGAAGPRSGLGDL